LGLEQIIFKCLARLTILHFAQIFLTADFIFIEILAIRQIQEKNKEKTLIFQSFLIF